MHPLHEVNLFSKRWHTGEWSARTLPDALGAEVVWGRGGSKILGFALAGPDARYMVLNDRVRGTPLEAPLVFHEAAHIIQGDLLGFCGNEWAERQCERNAIYGSALLAIPTEAAVAMVERRATAHELAMHFEVPRPMPYLRSALAVLLGEAPGDRQNARSNLAVARRSLGRWMAWEARGICRDP